MRVDKSGHPSHVAGWKVTHVKTPLGRWGTDVEFTLTGRIIKWTGKLTKANAIILTAEYLKNEAALSEVRA